MLNCESGTCFHCQQAVEKYLKAFLIYNNKITIKTHNIDFLIQECSLIDADFSTIDIKNLDDYAVEVRYPDSFLEPDLDEAKEYFQIVQTIKTLVLNKMKLE